DPLQLFYHYQGGRIYLTPSLKRIAVRFAEDVNDALKENFLSINQNLDYFVDGPSGADELVRIQLKQVPDIASLEAVITDLSTDTRVSYITPVFERSTKNDSMLTDSFVVKFLPEVTDKQIEAMNNYFDVEFDPRRPPGLYGRFLLKPRNARTAREVLKIVNLYHESSLTVYSSPDFRHLNLLFSSPDDTDYSKQWHLNNTGQPPAYGTTDSDIDAPEGWDLETGDSDMIIAIVDTGIDWDHSDLNDHIWENAEEANGTPGVDDDENGFTDDIRGWDFENSTVENPDPNPDDDEGHGTNCAGVAAAETDNSAGVAGVSWNSRLMAIKGLDENGNGNDYNLADGIEYAWKNGADVISCSWGDSDTQVHELANVIKDARNQGRDGKGCVLVFASGDPSGTITYPGYLDQLIAVGATDEDDVRWTSSRYGSSLDVMAPGGVSKIVTTNIGGGYTESFGGTSASCPQVAGLAALLLSQNPDLRASEVQSLIQASAEDKGSTGWDQYYGWGRINAYNALATETPLPGSPRSLDRFEIRNGSPTPTPLAAFDQFGFLY
ncbi:MAG: S8 family serine peptidase, partial [Candidatus Omnitrophica bacterium]|nr:S8 family serine peptidase [Candidatus Omnitrophota bacterium]